jgi:hypothetical protein
MKIVIAAALIGAGLFSASLYATYRIGYENGASVGYQAGVAQHRLYQKGHAMAADWQTYDAFQPSWARP